MSTTTTRLSQIDQVNQDKLLEEPLLTTTSMPSSTPPQTTNAEVDPAEAVVLSPSSTVFDNATSAVSISREAFYSDPSKEKEQEALCPSKWIFDFAFPTFSPT